MKTKLLVSASILLIGISGAANAQSTSAALGQTGQITPDDCAALGNNVTIQLSNGVVAAYRCTANTFVAATCHSNGTNKQQTIPCTYTQDTDEDGNLLDTWTASSAQCPGYDPADTAESATFNGRIGFRGGSGGGSVGPVELADPTCSTTTVITLVQ